MNREKCENVNMDNKNHDFSVDVNILYRCIE